MGETNNSSIDQKDSLILDELVKNSRQTYSTISKKVRIPKNVLSYRMSKLIEKGIIKNFSTIIDYKKIGYSYFGLYLKTGSFEEIDESLLSKLLRSKEEIRSISFLEGTFDIKIDIIAEDSAAFEKLYYEIMQKIGKYLVYREINLIPEEYYVIGHSKNKEIKLVKNTKIEKINAEELKILNLLTEDSRIPKMELSMQTGLSPITITKKLNKFKKRNILLGYTLDLNHHKLGLSEFYVLLSIKDKSDKTYRGIINYLGNTKGVTKIKKIVGKWDLEFNIVIKNHHELSRLMRSLKSKFQKDMTGYDSLLVYEKIGR